MLFTLCFIFDILLSVRKYVQFLTLLLKLFAVLDFCVTVPKKNS